MNIQKYTNCLQEMQAGIVRGCHRGAETRNIFAGKTGRRLIILPARILLRVLLITFLPQRRRNAEIDLYRFIFYAVVGRLTNNGRLFFAA
ncbi:MAG TPA: hypothetical protein VK484_01775 [Ferruginibacter sp.]|nr:hypothetical protein [Ferruginibacter sp.]